MSIATVARALAAAAVVVVAACGEPPESAQTATDSAAAPAAPSAPTLVVGGRYETQAGSVVCPRPEALARLVDVAQRGDTAAFAAALSEGGCSPVVPGAIVHVAEQRGASARVLRTGDAATYWMLADKLTPR